MEKTNTSKKYIWLLVILAVLSNIRWFGYNYETVIAEGLSGIFKLTMLFAYLLVCICVIVAAYEKCRPYHRDIMRALLSLFLILTFPMFADQITFGNTDTYLCILFLSGICLVICKRLEWLMIGITLLGIYINPSFALKFYPVLFWLLLYRFFKSGLEKYRAYAFGSAAAGIVLFCYKEFIAFHTDDVNGSAIIRNWFMAGNNYVELLLFVLLFLPYLLALFWIVKQSHRSLFLLLLPYAWLYFDKVNYGIITFDLLLTYLAVLIVLLCFGDEKLTVALHVFRLKLHSRIAFPIALLIYPILFMPFWDISISYSFDMILSCFH